METKTASEHSKYTAPWVRIAILLISVTAAGAISRVFTGQYIPTSATDALVMQNALLLVVFGSALLEHYFTKPADSAVNALMGLVTIMPVQPFSPALAWSIVTAYCVATFAIAIVCVAASTSEPLGRYRQIIADITYSPSVILGQARLLFSIVFLFAIFSFYEIGSPHAAALIVFWGLFVVIWPLRLPQLITQLFSRPRKKANRVGQLIRTDSPRVLRFSLDEPGKWNTALPMAFVRPSGDCVWVLPIYSHFHHERQIGTALELGAIDQQMRLPGRGGVFEVDEGKVPAKETWFKEFGQPSGSELVGFVVENSEISQVQFETRDPRQCHDGMLVRCGIGERQVYYQVTNGRTTEESFDSDRHGYQVARAAQLGIPEASRGFVHFDWLPQMNEPVFSQPDRAASDLSEYPTGDFLYGTIPYSKFPVSGDVSRNFNHHTALLGVTGAGKTELAFDWIRYVVGKGIKVICVDLTDQYQERLRDLTPKDLSVEEETADDLNKKLFDVETGQYGAGAEKKALKEFGDRLRADVTSSVHRFIDSGEDSDRVGIIRLQEISNTKATLWITELYLSCILNYARETRGQYQQVLVVVEEAHTVMPEPATMGVGDFDSKGIVGKISQVALQGRKYGVGLLVIAQRTANVSKTVLTQCNTVVSFAGYDDTSLNFLRNVFGTEYVSVIPRLGVRQAVVFGKAVRSDRPVVVQIPYDPSKDEGRDTER